MRAPRAGRTLRLYYGIAIILVLWYVLTFTPFGQRALFVGESREVARLSGFRVASMRLQGFVIAGFVAVISGILSAGTSGSASPDTGAGLLLPAYAAAFLGMTTIQPWRFNAIGAGIAFYSLATGVSGLELLGGQNCVQELSYGSVLVIAIVISRLARRRGSTAQQPSTVRHRETAKRERPSRADDAGRPDRDETRHYPSGGAVDASSPWTRLPARFR